MRIAVAGLGFMGSTHVKTWGRIAGATLGAVVSRDERKLSGDLTGIQGNLGGEGGVMDFSQVRKYRDISDCLADPDIDAIDICLPTSQHAAVTIAALEAGKHVLVEKPIALTGEDADRMIAAAERAGRILMAGQVLRFIPDYRRMADMLRAGELGPVRSAFFRRRCAAPAWSQWLADPALSGGGAFDLLIHDVDFCMHLFGAPEAVSATGYTDAARGIDWLHAHLHYRSQVPVIVTGGWHHPKSYPFSMEFTVVSDGGTLEYGSAGRPLTLYAVDGETRAWEDGSVDLFEEELSYFCRCVTSGEQPALCPPAESAAAVRIMRQMLASREKNGERVLCRL